MELEDAGGTLPPPADQAPHPWPAPAQRSAAVGHLHLLAGLTYSASFFAPTHHFVLLIILLLHFKKMYTRKKHTILKFLQPLTPCGLVSMEKDNSNFK